MSTDAREIEHVMDDHSQFLATRTMRRRVIDAAASLSSLVVLFILLVYPSATFALSFDSDIPWPALSAEDFAFASTSLKEARKERKKLESNHSKRIAELDTLIDCAPDSKEGPDWEFEKADLQWQLEHSRYAEAYLKYHECISASVAENECSRPTPAYTALIDSYRELLAEHPEHAEIAKVQSRLAKMLVADGQGPEAVAIAQTLIKEHPKSEYRGAVHLLLGEFFLDREMVGAARDNLKKALELGQAVDPHYARYALGWAFYVTVEEEKALEQWKKLLEELDDQPELRKRVLNELPVDAEELE